MNKTELYISSNIEIVNDIYKEHELTGIHFYYKVNESGDSALWAFFETYKLN